MKLYFSVLLLFVLSFQNSSPLLDRAIPNFTGATLDNKIIDSTFFRGKVTVVNFLSLGCRPCMKEIAYLNVLDSMYKNELFQVISIAPHSRERLLAFNSDKKSQYSSFRKEMGAEIINFNFMPEGETTVKSETDSPNHLTLNHDCDSISKLFGVDSYPTTFLVDKKGIIRKIVSGYPMDSNDSTYKAQFKSEIDRLFQN